MVIRMCMSVTITATTLMCADQPLALTVKQQNSNCQVLQPRDLNQLSRKKFQDLLSKAFSAKNNALKELRGVASLQSVCSIPLLELKAKNPNRFDNETTREAPRTFDHIAGATPAPTCKTR